MPGRYWPPQKGAAELRPRTGQPLPQASVGPGPHMPNVVAEIPLGRAASKQKPKKEPGMWTAHNVKAKPNLY